MEIKLKVEKEMEEKRRRRTENEDGEMENVGEINASNEFVLAACFNGERVENWPRKQKPSR